MAKELVEKRGLKQDEVAEILGISQSAVSKYTRKVRGYVLEIEKVDEVQPVIHKMIHLLIEGNGERPDFLKFFCQTCIIVRRSTMMCESCKKADSRIEIENCGFCAALSSRR